MHRFFVTVLLASIFIGSVSAFALPTTGGVIEICDSPQEGCVVSAMTFNIRVDTFLDMFNGWKGRRQIAIDAIAANDPDVVGLQEALHRQVRDIEKGLPEYACYTAGRSNGKKRGEACSILYRKSRFDLLDSGTFWFSRTPSKPGSKNWGNIPPRICSWVHLNDKNSGRAFYVYNVHLDNLSQRSRQKSVELLAEMVSNRKTADEFIVMGDFNMKIDNPAMRYLQKNGVDTPFPKMVDAWESLMPSLVKGVGTRHGFSGGINGPKIDHIPISENSKALEVKIDRYNKNGKYPSDHFPVIAKIQLGF